MKKYLFVDDDRQFLDVLALFFGLSPHVYVSHVDQVLPVLTYEGPFDIMVTDYDMPEQNGVELACWVKNLYPDVPILMVSGHEKPDFLPPCITQWILKPIALDVLDRHIRLCLNP